MKKTQTAFRIHPDTLARLKQLAEKKHISQAALVQMALNEYLERHALPDCTAEDREDYKPGK